MFTVPDWVPLEYVELWKQPWTMAARTNPGFRRLLQKHGYLTPNFSLREARCHDPAKTPVPHNLIRKARDHAFNLERLRHKLGDRPMPVFSWYRTPAWNRHEHGASQSKHMEAIATDFTLQTVRSLPKFDYWANRVFALGGFGTYPGGARHTDSRKGRARWSTWVPTVILRIRNTFTEGELV